MKIIKRDGSEVPFDYRKIKNAIEAANAEVAEADRLSDTEVGFIVGRIEKRCDGLGRSVSVEEIQDMVIDELDQSEHYRLARHYSDYRLRHELLRKQNSTDAKILALLRHDNELAKQENANKDPIINSTMRDYLASEVSEDICRRYIFPEDVVKAHDEGIIHIHDMGYVSGPISNCELVNLEDMLQNGTVITDTLIEKPHSFSTACNIATQIIAQVASNTYGGQTISLAHLAPFVDVSRQKYKSEIKDEFLAIGREYTEDEVNRMAEMRVRKEVQRGIQTIQYQIQTLLTTNGQTPFVSVFMYLDEVEPGQTRDDLALIIAETLKQRHEGIKNEVGVWVSPAFPKLIYVLDEDNITEDAPYYYLTELAAKCSAKRMVPDYISAKVMKQLKNGDVYTCMGCRAFLTPDTVGLNPDGSHKYYGRFNQGAVTINLVDVACSAEGDEDKFWKLMEERTELCHKALRIRHETLLGTPSDVAPILWQYGAISRLGKGEKIDRLLYDNYSTISLGYAGLCECVYRMKGVSHTDPVGHDFGIAVMKFLNKKTAQWREAENISYSLYGTPMESSTYKFARCLQKRFGKIPHVTDKNYITNSYHVHVTEPIDAFTKLSFEAEFQALSPGGAISYVEVPNMQNNIPAVLAVMRFIYDNIMYAELNTKSDYCQVCGYDGEIKIVEDDGKLVWECPNCGNRDEKRMNVCRRVCGYLGTNYFNQGRTQEIAERVLHL
ncbi:anaerobic ribonucleoside-triphosphate reductase [Chordicoccus furentiruminis]|uniref:anaerobic ribonucleoside-triphosphate reductase n=1 Tax=Chordicoccus furentiruminis TaxID=2709410 RepID=UPI0023A834DD|nr:anaerobic ribonucleoside-triphosphate reductase [Chordicoccus furentiruminis]